MSSEQLEDLRRQAASLRNVDASQDSDIGSGNYPKRLDTNKLMIHVDDLRKKADDLDAEADEIERGL